MDAARKLKIGNRSVDGQQLRQKLQGDIGLIQQRLDRLAKQANPNPELVDHFQTMLQVRQSVLDWLNQQP